MNLPKRIEIIEFRSSADSDAENTLIRAFPEQNMTVKKKVRSPNSFASSRVKPTTKEARKSFIMVCVGGYLHLCTNSLY